MAFLSSGGNLAFPAAILEFPAVFFNLGGTVTIKSILGLEQCVKGYRPTQSETKWKVYCCYPFVTVWI